MKTKKLFHKVYGEKAVKFDHKSDDQFIIWKSVSGEKYTTFKSEFLDVCRGYLANAGYKITNITKPDSLCDLVCVELEYYPDFVFGSSEYDAIIKATKKIFKLVKKNKTSGIQMDIGVGDQKIVTVDVDSIQWLGKRIDVAISDLLRMANSSGVTHTTVFNGVTVIASPGANATDIEEAWCTAQAVATEVWNNSDRAKAMRLEADERSAALQSIANNAIITLKTLDFNDQVEVLEWLCGIQEASDTIGVKTDNDFIIETFEANGYHPNVNTGIAFNGDDADNFARYIIGQALSGLQSVGAIHHVVTRFSNDWKEKFQS